jgi:protein involved in polysaccharide export with SLBB domain
MSRTFLPFAVLLLLLPACTATPKILGNPTLAAQPGEFYIMGHVNRPGVYQLTGKPITLRQALAAAGNLDQILIPRRVELIRREGPTNDVLYNISLQNLYTQKHPDFYIYPNDLINLGTDQMTKCWPTSITTRTIQLQ